MKILLIDIETSPNIAHVWGLWKQNVGISQIMDSGRTMCFAAKWLHDDNVMFMSEHHDGHKTMINAVWHLLDEADAVVHYNGAKFDIPTLNKEFLLYNYMPPSPYHQIDLLSVTKNRFKFVSNKLDYVAKALGLEGKVKLIGHELWVQCMAGNDDAWKDMERYNTQDVLLLEDVYDRLLPWIKNHPNYGSYIDSTEPVCTNCGSTNLIKKGVETTKVLTYQRYRCKDCATPLRSRIAIKKDRSHILTQDKK